jgi:hypothetical protein
MKYQIGDQFTSAHTNNLMKIVGTQEDNYWGHLYELANLTPPVVPGGLFRLEAEFEQDVSDGKYIPVVEPEESDDESDDEPYAEWEDSLEGRASRDPFAIVRDAIRR